MKNFLIVIVCIMFALPFCGCENAKKNTASTALLNTQKAQVNQFLQLVYSTDESSEINQESRFSDIKSLTTDSGYQNLISSGTIYIINACETDFSCEITVKKITVSPDTEVENVFNFLLSFDVKFESGNTLENTQSGLVTVFEGQNSWLIDNLYESTPKLYDEISKNTLSDVD